MTHASTAAATTALLLLAAVVAPACGTFTTTQRPNDDNVILGRQVDDDTVLQFAVLATGDDQHNCLKLEESNRGFRFKSSETTEGVSLDVCQDGRDCAKLFRCRLPHPKLCLSAFDCYDPAGKNRCFKFSQCQCFSGSFGTQDVPSGFTFVPPNVDMLTDREVQLELTDVFPRLLKREQCFDNTTFNLRACKPDDTDCEAFKACRPEDGDECLQLIPGTVATAPAAPVTA